MKKLSLILSSLILFAGVSLANMPKQEKEKAKTEKKSDKKEVKKVPSKKKTEKKDTKEAEPFLTLHRSLTIKYGTTF